MRFMKIAYAPLIVALVSLATPASAQMRTFYIGDNIKVDDSGVSGAQIIGCHPADGQMSIFSSGAIHRVREGDRVAINFVTYVTKGFWERTNGPPHFNVVHSTRVLKVETLIMSECTIVFQDLPNTPKR